jgi:lipoprotein-anchoring transpeptidase ErfK/SrfK
MVLGSVKADGRIWLRVRLPFRPNGSAGWIPRDRVRLNWSPHFLIVDLSSRRLSLYRKGRLVARPRVVVGARGTPTPVGLFAIYDRVLQRDPDGFTGPWVLPLTAHSESLQHFDGGPGLVALHGRDGPSLYDPLGTARSHGCVRMNNGWISHLARMMKGTAVQIRR